MLSGSVAENALYMAYHEMNEILDIDEKHVYTLRDKFILFFAHEDHWATRSHEDDLLAAMPGVEFWRSDAADHVLHAFVLTTSVLVANRTWAHLLPRLK